MRAAIIEKTHTVSVTSVADPVPGPREVVVDVAACGICGTDKEITITGSMAVLHSFERAAELFAAGVLDPDVFIGDRLPLDDYAAALDRFKRGIGRKIQVIP